MTCIRTQFINGDAWPDDHGRAINAHGGGILFHAGVYYWFGEHKVEGEIGNTAQVGVHVYTSTDLYNWRDAGIALAVSEDTASDITRGCILERPKVLYNASTGRFVMWFHLELAGKGYHAARAGVAVSDRPEGPYRFLHSLRPNAGFWPENTAAAERAAIYDDALMNEFASYRGRLKDPYTERFPYWVRDFGVGQMSRDMTLFQDDDGAAYLVSASEENMTLHISRLTDDFLYTSGRYVRVFPRRWHEAPAICKSQGKYWMISSDCTGWDPNPARSAVSDSIWGPWRELGNPATGINPLNGLGPEKTFGGQSTFILKVPGKRDAFIAMFDVWTPRNPVDGGYVWLPIEFRDGQMVVSWRTEWNLGVFDEHALRRSCE